MCELYDTYLNKAIFKRYKDKKSMRKKNRAHRKDWWNRGTTIEWNVWQKYIPNVQK